jgi:hypothetical protein
MKPGSIEVSKIQCLQAGPIRENAGQESGAALKISQNPAVKTTATEGTKAAYAA